MTKIFRFFNMLGNESENSNWLKAKKSLHQIIFFTFLVSVALGLFVSDDWNDRIFLALAGIMIVVLTVKLFIFVGNTISGFLDEMILIAHIFQSLLPLFTSKKILPINIWFPFDWKTNVIAYWIAYFFVTAELYLYVSVVSLLTAIVWYLMLNCSIKYQMLGDQFRRVGEPTATKQQPRTASVDVEKQKGYLRDLYDLMKKHQRIKELTDRLASFFSILFLFQITTSGIGICASIYVLAFDGNENLMRSIVYVFMLIHNIFDIFIVMYFGNEIQIHSDRLGYCLFESENWMHQSVKSKKCFTILAEILKRPHELVVVKLHRLDLERVTSVR